MDTSFDYSNKDYAYVSTDEKRYHNLIRKWVEEYPDQVKITAEPDSNDGYMNAKFPMRWLKVKPSKKRQMTEEQKAALSERLQRARKSAENRTL